MITIELACRHGVDQILIAWPSQLSAVLLQDLLDAVCYRDVCALGCLSRRFEYVNEDLAIPTGVCAGQQSAEIQESTALAARSCSIMDSWAEGRVRSHINSGVAVVMPRASMRLYAS